jgi:hypothetical protein
MRTFENGLHLDEQPIKLRTPQSVLVKERKKERKKEKGELELL